MKNRIDSLRQKTPWDKDSNPTVIQKFIINQYKDNFYDKYSKLSEAMKQIIQTV